MPMYPMSKCLTFANADVAEFTVPAGAKITKNLIKDLGLPKGTTIGGMIRNGEGVLCNRRYADSSWRPCRCILSEYDDQED